jgi:tRNA-specific 2-thiouridylase
LSKVIYIREGKAHPGLYRLGLLVKNEEVHWVRNDLESNINETLDVMARIRYRQIWKSNLIPNTFGLYVTFVELQSAIAEGQFVAWYSNEELLGSGVIA